MVEGQPGDDLAGLGRHLVEEGERVGERLVLAQPEAVLVGVLGVAVVAVALEDGVQPAPLGVGDVLDQAADAQRAAGGRGPRLLLGESVGGDPQHVPLLVEVGEQSVALVADGGNLSGHADIIAT